MAALATRESLLKVCRPYQEPSLGKNYANVARYYEKQVEAIAFPGEQMPAAQQPATDELRS